MSTAPAMDDIEILPWHAALWDRVNDARRTGRLGHALLLAGPSGVGKRLFAMRLAASLLCEQVGDDGAPCGRCRGCAQRAAGTHPNLTWLAREINAKTDKEKRDISMDQLRAMMERLGLASHYGHSRVVVIDPADALNASGVNAVLKTVEEPPPGIHIVLISERPMALAPTMRSRCQRLSLSIPARDQAEAWLRTRMPGVDAAAALREAGGAPLAALEARAEGTSQHQASWREMLMAVASQKLDPLAAAARIAPAGAKLTPELVQEWLRHLHRVLLRLLRAMAGFETDPALTGLARRIGASHVEQLLAEIVESQRRVLGNANPQLTVESLMISWWRRTGAAKA
ncbi:MAG: holB [Panacagrimonas sp.]|nr:AAA family ATPase [Panacagrimonas sp.]MCC2658438.1 holB [Panacagrimonas sp.]